MKLQSFKDIQSKQKHNTDFPSIIKSQLNDEDEDNISIDDSDIELDTDEQKSCAIKKSSAEKLQFSKRNIIIDIDEANRSYKKSAASLMFGTDDNYEEDSNNPKQQAMES